jgi:hypothetical protein
VTAEKTIRVLILAKTYPEPNDHHTETVCTAGVTAEGEPVRLYPVRLRYLDKSKQYGLYDVIEVAVSSNNRDQRPESYKVNDASIRTVDHIDTDSDEWAARRDWIWRRSDLWHFPSMSELKARQQQVGQSIGFVEVGEVLRVTLKERPAEERQAHEAKIERISAQGDAFQPAYKDLDFIPYEIRMQWRCATPCDVCRSGSHDMKVLDWGLVELGRRDGRDSARKRLEEISNLSAHDFRVVLGNFAQYPQTFGIIALWYPKRSAQQRLF